MQHPTLTKLEKLIVDSVMGTALEQTREMPLERRAAVLLAVQVDLAGETLRAIEGRDTEPPPPEPSRPMQPETAGLCGKKYRKAGNVLHCARVINHGGDCW
jgi:hypothetical protein